LSYIISTLGPALYVALTVFHQELIPTSLLISIAEGRERVPFPAILEAWLMIFTFDILREAGIRLPKAVGQTIGIVGALVLGQASVEAGLISPIMVIVVSATAIASFAVPAQTDSGTILRYIFLALAGIAGGFGVIMGLLVTLIHLTSLRSFGTPYLWPIAPLNLSAFKISSDNNPWSSGYGTNKIPLSTLPKTQRSPRVSSWTSFPTILSFLNTAMPYI
jgi:spore germination protein KA